MGRRKANAAVANTIVAGGKKWRRIATPKPWKPAKAGAAIIGRYAGRHLRVGPHGEYEVLVVVNDEGTHYLSGQRLLDLMDGAGHVPPETWLRVVYTGTLETAAGHTMKTFELFVER